LPDYPLEDEYCECKKIEECDTCHKYPPPKIDDEDMAYLNEIADQEEYLDIPKHIIENTEHAYHFLIILDKNYNNKLNRAKIYLYKLLNNKNFIAYFQKAVFDSRRDIAGIPNSENDIIDKDGWYLPHVIEKYRIPEEYQFILTELIKAMRINKRSYPKEIIKNLNKTIIQNITYQSFFKGLIYLFTQKEYFINPQCNNATIKTEYHEKISKTDLNNSYLIINYLQNKHLPKSRAKIPKFDFDKYYTLKELDDKCKRLNLEMSDVDKSDIIFNINIDNSSTGKYEDKKNADIIRAMRKRYKEYFR